MINKHLRYELIVALANQILIQRASLGILSTVWLVVYIIFCASVLWYVIQA
jgi:hypothetical protein